MPIDEPPGDERGAAPDYGSDEFFARVYHELRMLAHSKLRGERSGYTLQSTELVHEVYLRLAGDEKIWADRRQFFAAAAEAMRRILIDRARAKASAKRGGDAEGKPAAKTTLELSEVAALADDADPEAILALDRAIERLAARDERAAQVVRLRFYAGLSVEEVGELFETSSRTVLRDWAFARAWLFKALSQE